MSDRYTDLEWGGTPFYHMTREEQLSAALQDEANVRRQKAWKEGRHEEPRDENDIDTAATLKAISTELVNIRIQLQQQAKEIAFLKKQHAKDSHHQPSTNNQGFRME